MSDGETMLMVSAWIDDPAEIYTWRRADGARLRASQFNQPLLEVAHVSEWSRWSVSAPDGVSSEAFVVHPRFGAAARGVVLELHGGPHAAHPNVGAFGWLWIHVMAAAGFHVILPNPRGSIGYGDAFSRAVIGDWGGGDFSDVLAAAGRSCDDPDLATLPVFVGGYSYGGYLAAWAISQTNRFRAAVIGAPMTNLVSWAGTTDLTALATVEMGGTIVERFDEYVARSPLTHAGRVATPALLFHHEQDMRCPMSQSEEFFTALTSAGVSTQLVRYQTGAHDSSPPSHLIDRLSRTKAWYLVYADESPEP